MKSPEEYIERNIKVFESEADKTKVFGTSYVQRICRVGYNQACYTISAMLDRGMIQVDEVDGWKYAFRHRNT